jgi:hypothetical protein
MTRKRSLIEFSYAAEEDDEWTTLAVTSREMLAVERTVKGFTAQTFFASVTVQGLYRVAHVVLRLRGTIAKEVTFEEFVAAYDVKFGSAEPAPGEDDDEERDETGIGADPTEPAA